MEDMSPKPHQPDVLRSGILALAVHNGALKHVGEFRPGAEEVRAHKVHHTPVLHQVVLEWVTCK